MTTTPDCGTFTIPEAASVLGIGESTAYAIAKTERELVPGVPIIRIRSLLRVSRYALEHFLEVDRATHISEPDHDTVPARQSPPAYPSSPPHARAGSESQQRNERGAA